MAGTGKNQPLPWLSLSGLMGYEGSYRQNPGPAGRPQPRPSTPPASATPPAYSKCATVLGEAVLKNPVPEHRRQYHLTHCTVPTVWALSVKFRSVQALLKPTDFDVEGPWNTTCPPAYIAAPVLKRVQQPEIP